MTLDRSYCPTTKDLHGVQSVIMFPTSERLANLSTGMVCEDVNEDVVKSAINGEDTKALMKKMILSMKAQRY